MAGQSAWMDSVEEHREVLEQLSETDLPLSDDARRLLEEYEKHD